MGLMHVALGSVSILASWPRTSSWWSVLGVQLGLCLRSNSLLGLIWCLDLEIGVGVVHLDSSWNCLHGALGLSASWRLDPGPPPGGLCLASTLFCSDPPGADSSVDVVQLSSSWNCLVSLLSAGAGSLLRLAMDSFPRVSGT